MPRIPLQYTTEFPYHVCARSNNREWFYLPQERIWEIFVRNLNELTVEYGVKIHAFVLMENHYHLLISASAKLDLGSIMQRLQRSVAQKINWEAGRINHLFGGPYKGCLINSEKYYHHVLKYVYRNPVAANLCSKVEYYRYSTVLESRGLKITALENGIDCHVPKYQQDFLDWLNHEYCEEQQGALKKTLRKTEFKFGVRQSKFF